MDEKARILIGVTKFVIRAKLCNRRVFTLKSIKNLTDVSFVCSSFDDRLLFHLTFDRISFDVDYRLSFHGYLRRRLSFKVRTLNALHATDLVATICATIVCVFRSIVQRC